MALKILAGFGVTVFLTVVCFVTATLIGTLTCAGFCCKNKTVKTIAKVYNGIVIKVPPLVMLMLFAIIIGNVQNDSSLLVAYTGLSLFVAANLSGVFLGGVNSVAKGEMEAARTVGMNKSQTFFHIMLPQIIQSIAPVYVSMFIMCMQITSVASVIGVNEFFSITNGIANATLGILLSIAGYFIIGTLGEFLITRMGKGKHIRSDLGSAEVN